MLLFGNDLVSRKAYRGQCYKCLQPSQHNNPNSCSQADANNVEDLTIKSSTVNASRKQHYILVSGWHKRIEDFESSLGINIEEESIYIKNERHSKF